MNKSLRFIRITLLSVLAASIIGWFLYQSWGYKTILAMYDGRSLEILNRIIAGQAQWTPLAYLRKADRLMLPFLKGFFFISGVLSAGVLCAEYRIFQRGFADFIKTVQQARQKDRSRNILKLVWRCAVMYSKRFLKVYFPSTYIEPARHAKKVSMGEKGLLLLVSFTPLYYLAYFLFIEKIPYWFFSDPDLFYFANGINFLLTGSVGIHTNPGVVCQVLSGFFLAPVYGLAALSKISFQAFCMEHIQEIVSCLRMVFCVLSCTGVFFISLAVRRLTGRRMVSFLAVLLFLTVSLVNISSVRISPENVFIFLFGWWLFVFSSFLKDPKEKAGNCLKLCVITGLMLANKFTAWPLALFIFLLPGNKGKSLFWMTGGFLTGVLPLLLHPKRIFMTFEWGVDFLLHQKPYGQGEIGFTPLKNFLSHARSLVLSEELFFVFFFFVIFLLWAGLNRGKKEIRVNEFFCNVFLFSAAVGLVVNLRYEAIRYNVGALFLLATYVALKLSQMMRHISKSVVCLVIATAVVLFSLNITKTLSLMYAAEKKCIAFEAFVREIADNNAKLVIALGVQSGWIEPMLSPWALILSNSMAEGVLTGELEKRFSNYVFFNADIWRVIGYDRLPRIYGGPDWDYLIYADQEAPFWETMLNLVEYSEIKKDPVNHLTLVKIQRK